VTFQRRPSRVEHLFLDQQLNEQIGAAKGRAAFPCAVQARLEERQRPFAGGGAAKLEQAVVQFLAGGFLERVP
jgi:hypothetical protein